MPIDPQGAQNEPFERRRPRWRKWAAAALAILIIGNLAYWVMTQHTPGCSFYRPVKGKVLVAHAGGGLPDRMYPNSIGALESSYARGLRGFEMDFRELPLGLMRTGHDKSDLLDPRSAWLSEVTDWLRRHPDTWLLVDMKTDNLRGLKIIADAAPDLRRRIVPFVYADHQYDAVRSLDLSLPVYARFADDDPNWLDFANSHEFAAVALPEWHIADIPKVRHPVIVYTFDVMVKAPGAKMVITNCMVPA